MQAVIVGILSLILVAAGLLFGGLSVGSDRLLGGSIVASVLAAVLLFAGTRQMTGEPPPNDEDLVSGAGSQRQRHPEPVGSSAPGSRPVTSGSTTERYEPKRTAQRESSDDWVGGASEEDDPTDEPPVQRRPARVAALVARLDSEVMVLDGRPRYHMARCVHLLGRAAEPLPVSEANELGFSPCGLCEPDAVLAAGAASTL